MTAAPDLKEAIAAFRSGDLDRARDLAESGVASAQSADWQHLLGLIHCQLGNPAEGAEHLRAAAEAEPANAAFKVMLARALVDAGRADEVLAMPEPPPIASPAELALWHARAEAGDAAGNLEVAVDAWSRITAAVPRDWRAWGNLGNALAGQDRVFEAADAIHEATRLNPTEPAVRADAVAALINAGKRHHALLRFDDAEAVFRRAHELDPTDPQAIHHLGIALERTNRLDELARLLDTALESGIPKESLGYLFALLAWREGKASEAKELLLADSAGDEVASNALLAKVLDSLGDTGGAFAAAEAMNRAAIDRAAGPGAREAWDRQSDEYRDEQYRLAQAITPEWAAQVPALDNQPTTRVSFLLGFPRSGTTLLDTFLLGHPQVQVLEEKQLVGAAAKVVGRIDRLPDVPPDLLRSARETYFKELANHVALPFDGVVIDKFPLDMAVVPLIQAMLPGAPILFAQRHPCDVVLSGFLQPFGVVNFSDIRNAATYYDALMQIWTAARETMDLNVHTVVYEELVSDPEATLKPVLAFLGLEWDERLLDHQRTARERGTIVTPSYDQVTQPITDRASGRWKRYREQLEPVLPILLPWAEKLGYRD